ncbi:centromere protein U [Brachyistius frenatus]|uniref:centromere protein U n=1 Tax=Brachyistius frenatus TaxID=100188 RepID=UPI0037E7A5D2
MDSPDLSAIDKTSFLEGLQLNHGNPLHSTAMEEDLNVLEEGQTDKRTAGRKDVPKAPRAAGQRGGAAGRRKGTEEGAMKRRSRRNSSRPAPTATDRSSGRSPDDQASEARPVKSQQVKGVKRRSGGSQSPEDSARQGRRTVLSSDEEVDEDTCWKPSPKKATTKSSTRTRKSSSDRSKSRRSSSAGAHGEPEEADTEKRRRRGRRGGTEWEVVLEDFLRFRDDYRESVESKAAKRSIQCFSDNVRETLLEKISSCQKLKVLKRENAKVSSSIRSKTQRLLDAKLELMRAERQVRSLQKEEEELKVRSADLRQAHAFLRDVRALSAGYREHRHLHPGETETFGASSLAALLLEAKYIQAAECQPTGTNNRQGRRQKTDRAGK